MRMPMQWRKALWRVPAHLLNGFSAAVGIGLVQALVGAGGGYVAALLATGGAVYASLADVPNAPHRTWRRVSTAALVGWLVSVVVNAVQSHALALGLLTALVGGVSAMALAWGVRAGPISFVGVLAIVFTMAAAPQPGWAPWLQHAAWTAVGGALYLAWSMGTSVFLQSRFRTLALGAAMAATARLLRSRAEMLMRRPDDEADLASPVQAWIGGEAALSDKLQSARDLLFAARDSLAARRQTHLLLLTIELRDTLVVSELDLDLLGHDGPDGHVRAGLAAHLIEMASAMAQMEDCLVTGQSLPGTRLAGSALTTLAAAGVYGSGHPSAPLLATLLDRGRHMLDNLVQMRAYLPGPDLQARADVPLSPDELALFTSVEGWPLAALRSHLVWTSPVLRHALRTGLALGLAYFIALALPWSSHPAWLVLSVAVVLRGNLEQTLARRNARVWGTVAGCLLVLGLEQLGAAWLSTSAFLVAVGTAHAFLNVRYLVTAAAASVMALLQSHLVHPDASLAVDERLADTVLGALLAWAFSYVLPSWEQRNLVRLSQRATGSLARLAQQTVRWPEGPLSDLRLRLARRDVYEALDGLAAAAQRANVEPDSVRVPPYAFATLIRHCHALLADLASVRLLLERRRSALDPVAAVPLLTETAATVQRRLVPIEAPSNASSAPPDSPAVQADPAPSPAATPMPWAPRSPLADLVALPSERDRSDLMPWLRRRLFITVNDAVRVAQSAQALQALALHAASARR
jgi:uncharacterized membrane protein YccC